MNDLLMETKGELTYRKGYKKNDHQTIKLEINVVINGNIHKFKSVTLEGVESELQWLVIIFGIESKTI